ncbi:MAG: Holliday junction resolvase RuvX [Bacteroidota bacterium]
MSKAIGIDFGLKRTGIAITDDLCIIASPLSVVDSTKLMQFLSDLIAKENISTLVLGYPTRLDGSDSHITENVRILKTELEKNFITVSVVLQDERYSSAESMKVVHKAGKKKQLKDKGLIDKVSAAIILQDYLETLNNVNCK